MSQRSPVVAIVSLLEDAEGKGGHDTVDGSEICQSPIEVGSLATSMYNFLYIQAVVFLDF